MGNYHVYEKLDQIQDKLDRILQNQQAIFALLDRLDWKVNEEMSDLTALTTEVQNNTAVDSSAIELLNGLSLQLAAIANDPAAIQALAAELAQSSSALAAAVLANTPAVPVVPEEAPVEPPVETPPVENPPAETPPVETPPSDQPPLDSPPISV